MGYLAAVELHTVDNRLSLTEAPVPRLISATQHEPMPDSGPVSSARTGTSSDQIVQLRTYSVGDCVGGKYTLLERLGEGGMGAVWRAHNELLDVDVAIKLIRSDELEAPDGTLLGDRLLQEARAAARLGHPAIARVFDFGTTERNNPYIVMELLRGEDLAEALARRGRTSGTKSVSTLMPIAHALAAAHGQGIVHRDLKPENIFLARSEDGRVVPKLVDFGIAKIDRGKNHRLTQTGTMLGSPVYMSPEQARGDDVDHRADIWAFCVVLYEMITGHPPFEGKNYNALLYAIIADEPAPLPADIPGGDRLWEILQRGFQKEPEDRWPDADAMGRALAQWLMEQDVHEDLTGASLVAQWFRAAPSGDVLTSMLPLPMDNAPMLEIPARRERKRWAAETRVSEARRLGALALWVEALRHQSKGWRHELRTRVRHWELHERWRPLLQQVPALRERPKALLFGGFGSALGGALAVAMISWPPAPRVSLSPGLPVSDPVQVMAPLAALSTPEQVRTWIHLSRKSAAPSMDVAAGHEEARTAEPRHYRRPVVRPVPASKLKNPFD